MSAYRQNILLVEDNPRDALLVEMMLKEMDNMDYQLTKVDRMSKAMDLLDEQDFQAAILDMTLPDGEGVENIHKLKSTVADLPIVVLSGRQDEKFALETVKAGAQDYLIKGEVNEWQLSRALNYAVERKRLQEDVVYMAHHDQLTGLANRTLFRLRLEHALQSAQRRRELVALLYIDLDHFKPINDALGHDMGDKLLINIASILKSSVREVDTVGRLGGDEFAIILEGIEETACVSDITQKIINNIKKEMVIDEHSLYVGASIGVAVYPQSGEDADSLIKNADSAMYKAKKEGGNCYHFYCNTMNKHALKKLSMDMQLHGALLNNEYEMYYQPKINLKSGKVTGSEALIRWNNPQYGLQHPNLFIPQLEQNGMILDVGYWVLEQACSQHAAWKKKGIVEGRVAVNLSGMQLMQANFCNRVCDIIDKSGLTPYSLELELTESLLIQNTEEIIKRLNALREMGINIAIDDFGTGYSSFSYLKRFIIDTIKIDRSFICNITHRGADAAITSSITKLARDLGIQVVAEGVETKQQLDFLLKEYINEIQGYYISPPLEAENFEKMNFLSAL